MNQTMNIMLPASSNKVQRPIIILFSFTHIIESSFCSKFKKNISSERKKSREFHLAEILKLHAISEDMWLYLLSSLAFPFVALKSRYLNSNLSLEMCH